MIDWIVWDMAVIVPALPVDDAPVTFAVDEFCMVKVPAETADDTPVALAVASPDVVV